MNVSNIRIRDLDNRWESLPLALQAVARWSGVELPFRSINAALGLSFMVSAPRSVDIPPTWWMTFGRDAFLEDTARLFGISVRAIHAATPEAIDDRQQFVTAVLPRVQSALAANQPVLCWRGWPDYHSHLWGVITGADDGPLQLRGSTMWARGGLLPLATVPHRLYAVDDCEPRQPAADALLRFAIANILRVVCNRVDERADIVTGLAAYDRWIAWLGRDPQDNGHSAHHQMARFVTHARESACRFIDHYKDGLHEDYHTYLEAMFADCRGTIAALSTALDLRATEVLYRSSDGRDALAAGVRAARDFLEAQIGTIQHFADKLGLPA